MLTMGMQAPAFELKNLEGAVKRSGDYLEQGPTLFVFYKASCPICQLTLPFLERLRPTTALRIVLIAQDDAKTTNKFLRQFGLTMETLLDGRGYPASNAYRIENVPSLFLAMPDGRIDKSWTGFSKKDMEELALSAGQPIFRANDNVPIFKPG